jgi:AraC family transcriptional regulator
MDIEIVDRPELRIGGVRHVGPYHRLHEAFAQLGSIAGSAGLFGQPGVSMLGVYHDALDDVPEDERRSDAAASLPEGTDVPEGLTEQHLPGGRYATKVHAGSYARLAQTWEELVRGISASGHAVRDGPCYEIYLNNPAQVTEDELRTEIFVPVG